MNFIWNYAFRHLIKKYWGNKYRSIPVFHMELEGDMLGDFRHDKNGFNTICLSNNQGLTDRELMGVLLHEICHHVVYEEHGYEVDAHGFEWMAEMTRVGFETPDQYTDGTDFFSEEE